MTKLLLTLLIAVQGTGLPSGALESNGAPDLVIKASRVLVGNGDVLEDAIIHVRDGKIVAVGKGIAIPADARILDLEGSTVMPGMVESLASAGLPGGSAENEEGREHTASLRISQAIDAHHASLTRKRNEGVTSLAVHPGGRNVTGGVVCWVKPRGAAGADLVARDDIALRISLGRDPAAGHGGGRGRGGSALLKRRPNSRMSTLFEVRQQLQRAVTYGRRRERDPEIPPNPDYDLTLRALAGKIPVYWLARSENDIRAALRIAAEFGITRNVILEGHQADRCAAELSAAKVPVFVGPLFHPQYRGGGRRPSAADEPVIDPLQHAHLHDHDHEPVKEVCLLGCDKDHEHVTCGNPDHVHDETWLTCLGHDCCAMGGYAPPTDVHYPAFTALHLWKTGVDCAFARGGDRDGERLLDFARFAVRHGLPAPRAIQMVTLDPARILGIDDRVGSIAVGKDADLVVFNGDPLAPTSAVTLVVIDGEIVRDQKEKTR